MKTRIRTPFVSTLAPTHAVPTCDHEWQVVADLSNMILSLALARRYGLIKQNGQVNVGLCAKRLVEARTKGILPRNLGPGLSP